MEQIFNEYLSAISKKYSHEETSEYGYRTDFEILLNKVFDNVKVKKFNKRIDHDAKAIDGNKPDFSLFSFTSLLLNYVLILEYIFHRYILRNGY